MRTLRLVLISIVLGLALVWSVRTFVGEAFLVPSASMERTLMTGERIVVSRVPAWRHTIARGDVIVFRDPGGWLAEEGADRRSSLEKLLARIGVIPEEGGATLTKRVIGVGGDRIHCCSDDGRITVNGKAVTEPYVNPIDGTAQIYFDIIVPKESFLVMGDNRGNSVASRHHLVDGTWAVPYDKVVGTVVAVFAPFSERRMIDGSETLRNVRSTT